MPTDTSDAKRHYEITKQRVQTELKEQQRTALIKKKSYRMINAIALLFDRYFLDPVMVEMHGEGASALGSRPEIGGVAEHFLERHERMNALLGAGTDFCLQNLTPS